MINIVDASKKLLSVHPERNITAGYDYDEKWWLFEAVENDEVDYDSPYYVVNKITGDVRTYSPIEELDKFDYVLNNKRIK
jgi:hypothetical protein